jgi:hypothetical protein
MNVKEAMNFLNENAGNGLYKIFVPSIGKHLSFKTIKTGQFKSLCKIAIDDNVNFMSAMVRTIKDLCVDDIDIDSLNEIDEVCIITNIIHNNSIATEKYIITCNNTECGYAFKMPINLQKYADSLEKIKVEAHEKEITHNNITYKFMLNLPNMKAVVGSSKFIKDVMNQALKTAKKKEQDTDSAFYITAMYAENLEIFNFIKKLYINDNEISGLQQMSFVEAIEFIENIPIEVVDELAKCINENFSEISNAMTNQVSCPKCGVEFREVVNVENFFMR